MNKVSFPEIRLFNTLSRSLELLRPKEPGKVGVYCCGPTVYNYQHIGNLRTYIFEDLLVRTLRYAGYEVSHVMNITDVGHLVSDADEGEDKMALAAKREGKKSEEIASYYTNIFFEHCQWLNIKRPTIVCKATEHISQMIALIAKLLEQGCAYQSGGNVYFDVSTFPDYGKLARLDLERLQAGARVAVDSQKRNPSDFALWFTKSKFENQELLWESPWGTGYPGWHIECSAMAMTYLGESFDIHCGGIDHIPVHHTNEIAQSEGATGKQFAAIWMHGGFLVLGKDKMSKSSGEFLTLDLLKERGYEPLSYRLFCLGGSYRQELSWSWQALESASNSLKRLKNNIIELKSKTGQARISTSELGPDAKALREAFDREVFTDLNFAAALAVLHETVNSKTVSGAEKLALLELYDLSLGLGISGWNETSDEIPEEVIRLVEQRNEARKNKNWAAADALRQQVFELGFSIEDRPDGQKIKPC
jgi:cysteinyl-tRNA synthetase